VIRVFLCLQFLARIDLSWADSGSLVTALLGALLTVRTTYLPAGEGWAAGWYKVFEPAIVLPVPLYDLMW